MEPLPKSFYSLLPLGMAITWSRGITTADGVLQTLHLARHMPDKVLLMPIILRHVSPEVLSGGVYVFISIFGGLWGTLLALFSDRLGLKTSCKVAVAVQMVGQLLTAWPRTYLLGMTVSWTGFAAATPIFTALFTSQFGDEQLTQKLMTYLYAAQNVSFMLASVISGIQQFWVGYVESASLLLIALIHLVAVSDTLKDATDKSQSTAAPASTAFDYKRVYGFGVLCIFTALFQMIFSMFLGGPFMIFANEELAPIGTFRVPAQWFLSMNCLVGVAMGVPLALMYERMVHLRFYVKLRTSFVLMALSCGLLPAGVRLAHDDGTSPLVVVGAVVLFSIAELHYPPVMLAAISTEMPANMVGLFTSIHNIMGAPGMVLAGAGVSCYKSLGAEALFLILCGVAATGAVGLQLITPFLAQCFDEESRGECTPLRSIKTA